MTRRRAALGTMINASDIRRISLWIASCLLWLVILSQTATNAFTLHSQTSCRRRLNHLHLFFADPTEPKNGKSTPSDQVPFVIERISDTPSQYIFEEIAEMCIDVFFNDDPNPNAPWKQLQLGYLRNLQQSDLYHRKTSQKYVNDMFVARRVLPVSEISPKAALKRPIVLDLNTIINSPAETNNEYEDFVKDAVIGFVEVTEKQFGLGLDRSSNSERNKELRPVLTNLAVHPSFRKAGVGSQLLQACETIVSQHWKDHNEIVLEVEEDNPKALAFYQKRGYEIIFEDPASRRYDVNGFFLQKKQCTKICMRKDLRERNGPFLGSNLLQSLRESVFSK